MLVVPASEQFQFFSELGSSHWDHLIGQGATDRRVKQSESAQIVATLERNGVPVTYVVYPDEGHGFAHRANRLAFYAVAEAFLGQHLGGRVEPVGRAFDGSSITIPTGRQHIAAARQVTV